jgi:GntR family transcriptional regulator, rspAB operon transcriptional repressor
MNGASVFESIRAEILTCQLAPGALIYEQELAQRFGVSKSPVREALLRLQEQDLVEVRARSGYRVRPISLSEAQDMYEMRLIYEKACVEGAISRASNAQIDGLQEHLTTDANMLPADWIAMNKRFHSALAMCSGNAFLAEATNRLIDRFERFTFVSVGRLPQPVDFNRFNQEHLAIVGAMQARDKRRAIALIRAHIESSRLRAFQTFANPAVVP